MGKPAPNSPHSRPAISHRRKLVVAPVKVKVMVPVVVAPVIKALVARVLVVARPPQTQPPQKTVTGTQTLETQPLLMAVGKPAPNSHRSRPAISNRVAVVPVVDKVAVEAKQAIQAIQAIQVPRLV